MRQILIRKRSLVILVIAVCSATPAYAHVFEDTGGRYVNWFFAGRVYHGPDADHLHDTDPIQIDFQGGAPNGPECQTGNVGDATITEGCLRARIPESFLHPNKICGNEEIFFDNSYMRFDNNQGRSEPARSSFELYSARPAQGDPCARGYHIRFWDDGKHRDLTGASHAFRYQWQIGAIHHERRVGLKHQIDMDWDDVRVIFFKRVGVQWCGKRRWRVHPGAIGRWSKFENTGMLSRIPIGRSPTRPCSNGD